MVVSVRSNLPQKCSTVLSGPSTHNQDFLDPPMDIISNGTEFHSFGFGTATLNARSPNEMVIVLGTSVTTD